eukprot:2351884-Amphidinium_carterae.2
MSKESSRCNSKLSLSNRVLSRSRSHHGKRAQYQRALGAQNLRCLGSPYMSAVHTTEKNASNANV